MAELSILSSTPRCNMKIANVGDALSQLQAFNALYELNPQTSSYNNCGDGAQANYFRGLVRREVLNCNGKMVDVDWLEQIAGGPGGIQEIPAKEYTIMSQCGVDYNVVAASAAVGATPGAATQFQLHRAQHSGNGKYNPLAVGNDLYIYQDGQTVTITAIDTDDDYGHLITVVPLKTTYTVNIRGGSKIFVKPARNVGAYSCAAPTNRWNTPGYQNTLRPLRNREDWEIPIDLLKGFLGVMQFALILDKDGMEQDCFLLAAQQNARWNMKVRKNVDFFIGQSIDNPNHPLYSAQGGAGGYTGYEGYLSTMQHGGGQVIDFDPATGFDFLTDFEAIIRRNDSLKRTKEYNVFAGLNFMMGLVNANNPALKNSGLTFETFKRTGLNGEDIVKMGIKSYSYMNRTLHFKEIDGMTDSRYFGNYDIAEMAMMMPGEGITNSSGQAVPTIEMYMPYGCDKNNFNGYLWDSGVIDHRYLENKCEKLSGSLTETTMMGINCPHLHILLNPVKSCVA